MKTDEASALLGLSWREREDKDAIRAAWKRKLRETHPDKKPQEKQANIIWQIAYRDSITVFQLKMNMTLAQVLRLLRDQDIKEDVCLLPLDAKKPLSPENYFLASLAMRKVMCRIWKRFHCTSKYNSR